MMKNWKRLRKMRITNLDISNLIDIQKKENKMAKKTQEEIQRSIDKATQEWQIRKDLQKEHSNLLKAGYKFYKDNNVNHIHIHFGEYFIDLGYIVSSSGILKYAYSICSPNDIPNNKIAAKIIGLRFLEGDYVIPNVFIVQDTNFKISSFEIRAIVINNFKQLLIEEAFGSNKSSFFPRKIINHVKRYGAN